MSSSPHSKSYLGPSDLAMLDRVLARVNSAGPLGASSFEHSRMAALLVRRFEQGMKQESDLLAEVRHGPVAYPERKSASS